MAPFSLFHVNLSVFIFVVCCHTSQATIKQFFGAALMGDVSSIISVFTCPEKKPVDNFIRFSLYTRSQPDKPFPLYINNQTALRRAGFNSKIPTKIVIHGFLDNVLLSDWMTTMIKTLLQEGNYNVIYVDWSCGNSFPYTKAVMNAKKVAIDLYNLLNFMIKYQSLKPTDIHIIGHSLGAQIGGIVGRRLKNIGRISGLDPAGPLFHKSPLEDRLDRSDALFVDVIHTDGGNSLLEGLGMNIDLGHVDFYPSGGQTQPGCHNPPTEVLEKIGLLKLPRYYFTCDHFRAIYLYIESIKQKISKQKGRAQCQFIGVKCANWNSFAKGECSKCLNSEDCGVMGYTSNSYRYQNSKTKNILYLLTSDQDPYCVFQYRTAIEIGNVSALPQVLNNDDTLNTMQIEFVTNTNKTIRMKFNLRVGENLQPSIKQIFITASKEWLPRRIKSAALWLGNNDIKPTQTRRSHLQNGVGFHLKKIEIMPISFPNKIKQSKYQASTTRALSFCTQKNLLLTKGTVLKLIPCL